MTCVLCAATLDTAPVVNTVARNAYPQTSVACPRCGLVQVVPMPTADEVRAYYESGEYRREFPPLPVGGIAPGADGYDDALDTRAAGSASGIWGCCETVVAGARVHEVGCGDGRVSAALSIAGADVTAWDTDPSQRALADGRGVRLEERPEGLAAVVACQVLEHQTDPVATLREWRSMLAEDGMVHVQVPTLESMYGGAEYFFQRPHVVNFTARTLYLTMRVAGLAVSRIGIAGSVLWATATRDEPMSSDDALARCPYPPDDVPALIASHEATRVSRPVTPGALARDQLDQMGTFLAGLPDDREPFAALATWLETPDAPATPEVRQQAARALGELVRQRDVLRAYAEALGEEAERRQEEWSPDPWAWGVTCGVVMQLETQYQCMTALANNLHMRMGE